MTQKEIQKLEKLIAEAMGYKTQIGKNGNLMILIEAFWEFWLPSNDAEQRELIENWLIEQGLYIVHHRYKGDNIYYILKEVEGGKETLAFQHNSSKPIAFLQAVGEYIKSKK